MHSPIITHLKFFFLEYQSITTFLTENFDSALKAHPIVVITGARQVGKSTFLQNAKPTRELPFTTLDDLDVLDQAKRDPAALLSGKSKLIIDEIQKAPRVLSEIKKAVDQSRRQIRIILSGSANLLLMEKVSETLAGRAVFITMDSIICICVYGAICKFQRRDFSIGGLLLVRKSISL